MSSLRLALLVALFSTLDGCASTYAPGDLPPPRDFSVTDPPDMATGTGGNGGEDLAVASDLAVAMPADLAVHVPADLAMHAPPDLASGCVAGNDDGGVAPTLWLAAPAASGLFTARLRGGVWTALSATAGGVVDDVALAAVGGRPIVAARLHDATLAASRFDECHDRFAPLAAIAPAAATAARPALVGGAVADVIFRGAVNGDQRYYWAHFDGTSWGAIATQGNFLSALAPTALRLGGSVHTVFAGTDTNLWDGVVQTTGGGTSTQLTGNTSSMKPAAALAPDGALHVVYTGTNQHLYWFVAAQPATVHDLCDGQPAGCFIVTDAAPALAFASDGTAVTVFHGTDGKLYASRLSGTQWGPATGITGAETSALPPAVIGGVGGSLADVVYVRASDGFARHAQLTAGGWQAPVTVSASMLGGAPALATTP